SVTALSDTLRKVYADTGVRLVRATVKDRAGDTAQKAFSVRVTIYKRLTGVVYFGAEEAQNIVAFNGKLWVMGGNSYHSYTPDIWSSPDGVTWTKVVDNFPPGWNAYFPAIAFKGKLWV